MNEDDRARLLRSLDRIVGIDLGQDRRQRKVEMIVEVFQPDDERSDVGGETGADLPAEFSARLLRIDARIEFGIGLGGELIRRSSS
jgi:hypothetical protein